VKEWSFLLTIKNMSIVNYQITHIQQIISILDSLNGRIIVAVDWDNVISLSDGCDLPLRDPIYPYEDPLFNGDGQAVHDTFKELNARSIPWFIITARLHGNSALDLTYHKSLDTIYAKTACFNSCIINATDAMHEALPELSKQNILTPSSPELGKYNSITYNNIVFAGGQPTSNKGPILIDNIKRKRLKNFDYLVFIDNDYQNIVNVANIFKDEGLRKKLITIYYFQYPQLTSSKTSNSRYQTHKCERSNKFGSCMRTTCL
jgi:hypothetical protein